MVLTVFLQDLSKKDSALLKLGRELKELETVQEQLETKEQELRAERNTVSKLSYMSNLVMNQSTFVVNFCFLVSRIVFLFEVFIENDRCRMFKFGNLNLKLSFSFRSLLKNVLNLKNYERG